VISPDAAALTSNYAPSGGTGSEGSVKGAKALFSTKKASHVIADVYAVRADWFAKHKNDAFRFVHALMLAQERFDVLVSDKTAQKAKYGKLLEDSATLLVGSPQGTADVESMIGDADFVEFGGNVSFFTGTGTTRNFNVLKDEIQTAFLQLKVLSGPVSLQNAGWDYAQLAKGLKNADLNAALPTAFDAQKVQAQIEKEIATETTAWDEEGSLYRFEVYFEPKSIDFNPSKYVDAFKKVLKLSQSFGGAIITIEGHNQPDLYNKAIGQGNKALASAIEQKAKTLSMSRAQAVRDAFVQFAADKGIKIDPSQFYAVGMGATHPKFATPTDENQWKQNMRVVFRVKSVETELDSFQPAHKK
jgi:outer membrane protein OmpA-like peptidoglycan-associated protein